MVAQYAHPASLTVAGVGDQDDQKVHKGEINRGGAPRQLARPDLPRSPSDGRAAQHPLGDPPDIPRQRNRLQLLTPTPFRQQPSGNGAWERSHSGGRSRALPLPAADPTPSALSRGTAPVPPRNKEQWNAHHPQRCRSTQENRLRGHHGPHGHRPPPHRMRRLVRFGQGSRRGREHHPDPGRLRAVRLQGGRALREVPRVEPEDHGEGGHHRRGEELLPQAPPAG